MHSAGRFVLVTAIVALLSACVPGASPAPPAATPYGAEPAVTLRLMGWASSPEEDRLLNEVLDEFMAQHPTIQVKFEPVPEYATKLQTDLAAGTAADVFYVDSLLAPDLMKRELLMELDPLPSAHPTKTGAIAILVAAILIGAGRLFQLIRRFFATRSRHFLPRRLANVLGIAVSPRSRQPASSGSESTR